MFINSVYNLTQQTHSQKRAKKLFLLCFSRIMELHLQGQIQSMRAVIQRVNHAKLVIDDQLYSEIGHGLLVLLGIHENDSMEDVNWLVSKITQMRIFSDADDKMNLSVMDTGGSMMIVSQFTLHASTKKGNRPSFIEAARPAQAIPLYENFISRCRELLPDRIATGSFGADMKITLLNDGPVTIVIDSKQKE